MNNGPSSSSYHDRPGPETSGVPTQRLTASPSPTRSLVDVMRSATWNCDDWSAEELTDALSHDEDIQSPTTATTAAPMSLDGLPLPTFTTNFVPSTTHHAVRHLLHVQARYTTATLSSDASMAAEADLCANQVLPGSSWSSDVAAATGPDMTEPQPPRTPPPRPSQLPKRSPEPFPLPELSELPGLSQISELPQLPPLPPHITSHGQVLHERDQCRTPDAPSPTTIRNNWRRSRSPPLLIDSEHRPVERSFETFGGPMIEAEDVDMTDDQPGLDVMDDEIMAAVTRRFRSMRRPNRYEKVTRLRESQTLIKSATRPTPGSGVTVKKSIRMRRRKPEAHPAAGEQDAETVTEKERQMASESLSSFNVMSTAPPTAGPSQPDTL